MYMCNTSQHWPLLTPSTELGGLVVAVPQDGNRREPGRRQFSSPVLAGQAPTASGATRSRAGIATPTLAIGELVEIMVKNESK